MNIVGSSRLYAIVFVATASAVGVFLLLLRQPSGEQLEEWVAGDYQVESIEELHSMSVVQEEKSCIFVAEGVHDGEHAREINIHGSLVGELKGHGKGENKAPKMQFVILQPRKKKRIFVGQDEINTVSHQQLSKTEVEPWEANSEDIFRETGAKKKAAAEQLQAMVNQSIEHSLPAQESPPEISPRVQPANILAIMDGQDARLMNKAFESVPSHTFFAWDNNLSGYTFEVVLQPAYTDKKGSICWLGSIMAWKEPQALTTLYQQQKVTGCRMAKAGWFVR